eukprot:g63519.t1
MLQDHNGDTCITRVQSRKIKHFICTSLSSTLINGMFVHPRRWSNESARPNTSQVYMISLCKDLSNRSQRSIRRTGRSMHSSIRSFYVLIQTHMGIFTLRKVQSGLPNVRFANSHSRDSNSVGTCLNGESSWRQVAEPGGCRA